jgi:hypothetical protein
MFVEGFLQKASKNSLSECCVYLSVLFHRMFWLGLRQSFYNSNEPPDSDPQMHRLVRFTTLAKNTRKYMAYSHNTHGFSRISISGRFYTRRIYEMSIVTNAKYINTVPCHSWSASHEPLLQARDSLTLWPQMPKHKNMTYGLILKTILYGIMEHLYIIEGSREESRTKQEKTPI